MIKTFEALIAAALLTGTLALISSPYFIPEEKYSDLREIGEDAVLSFREKEEFRRLAVAVDDHNSLQELKNYTDNYIEYPYMLRVCEMDETCYGSIPEDKAYTVVSYLFDGNISSYSMKKIQLFIWLFEG